MTKSHYNNSNIIVIVFDLSSETSISNIQSWINEVTENVSNLNKIKILLGNKKDLLKDNKEVIKLQDIKKIEQKYNIKYYDISIFEDVELFFNTIITDYFRKYKHSTNNINLKSSSKFRNCSINCCY